MENLRILREERKLSQQKLADEFDLAQSQILYYEKGTYQPSISTLNKYADFFEVSVDFLLGRTDIRRRPEPMAEYALNANEQELVDIYRRLHPDQRHGLILFLKTLPER